MGIPRLGAERFPAAERAVMRDRMRAGTILGAVGSKAGELL